MARTTSLREKAQLGIFALPVVVIAGILLAPLIAVGAVLFGPLIVARKRFAAGTGGKYEEGGLGRLNDHGGIRAALRHHHARQGGALQAWLPVLRVLAVAGGALVLSFVLTLGFMPDAVATVGTGFTVAAIFVVIVAYVMTANVFVKATTGLASEIVLGESETHALREVWISRFAALLNVREDTLADKPIVSATAPDGVDVVALLGGVPAQRRELIANQQALRQRIETLLPEYDLHVATEDQISLMPASDETLERRALAVESGGLVASVERADDGTWLWSLSKTVTAKDAVAVDAYAAQHGMTLLRFAPNGDRAIAAQYGVAGPVALVGVLNPDETAIRAVAGQVLRVEPWDVDVVCSWSLASCWETVTIGRVAVVGAEVRERLAREILSRIVDAESAAGWTVEDLPDTNGGTLVLRWGLPPKRPDIVPTEDLQPERMDPSAWRRIPLGVDPSGEVVVSDLKANPHQIVCGPAGSGKSTFTISYAISALVRGHRLVMVDPARQALDYLSLKPWVTAWADTAEDAAAAMERVIEEAERRMAVGKRLGRPQWDDLAPEERAEHGIYPMTVIVDETAQIKIGATIKAPPSLPKDHPKRQKIEAQAFALGSVCVDIGTVARAYRAWGIFLVVLVQSPRQENMPAADTREQCPGRTFLVPPGKAPDKNTASLLFDSEQVEAIVETGKALDVAGRPGLALTAAEGGSVAGYQVAFIDSAKHPERVVALLESRGVPRVNPAEVWNLSEEPGAAEQAADVTDDDWAFDVTV